MNPTDRRQVRCTECDCDQYRPPFIKPFIMPSLVCICGHGLWQHPYVLNKPPADDERP